MVKRIGLGIIGLGFVGQIHFRHSLRLADAQLIAVSDVSKRALEKAKNAGVKKAFRSYDDLLKDPEVECVVVALPTHLHLQCAIKAAEAGKDILLEKPIARSAVEAREIVSVVRKNSVNLMMGYPLRFNPDFYDLKQKIESGVLGDIEVAYATNIGSGPFTHRTQDNAPTPVSEWWFNRELTGGGALIDLGSHMINLLRWYLGEVVTIRSHLGHRFNLDLEDSATCLATFESGTLAALSVGWFSQDYHLSVELFGTVKHAQSASGSSAHLVPRLVNTFVQGASKAHWPFLTELEYFVNCVVHDVNPSPSGEDGLKDIEAISLAYKNQINLSEEGSTNS